MSGRLLVVEDELTVATQICDALKSDGYTFDFAASVERAKEHLQSQKFNLVILDIGIPFSELSTSCGDYIDSSRTADGGNGFEVAAWLRDKQPEVRVIYMTDRSTIEDRIRGFDLGGDHYLTKPFDNAMFRAVVRSVLRRLSVNTEDHVDVFQKWSYSRRERQLSSFLHPTMKPIPVTHAESKILNALIDANGGIVSRETLSKAGFVRPLTPNDKAVETAIAKLRAKMGDEKSSNNPIIETIYGSGYRLRK